MVCPSEPDEVVGMTADENTPGKRETLPTLIAWLSTCMLAAGLGKIVEPYTHGLWLQAGCFGLVAAVGLDVSARMRWRRQRLKQWRDVQQRAIAPWRNMSQKGTSRTSCAAVTHLLAANRLESREHLEREEPRWSCNLQVEVYAVHRHGSSACPATDKTGVIGRLDNLSNSGFGLKLDQRLGSRLVIIAFPPPDEQEFDLLGEILWCDPYPDGRMCAGGRLLRFLPMASRRPGACRSTPIDDEPAEALC